MDLKGQLSKVLSSFDYTNLEAAPLMQAVEDPDVTVYFDPPSMSLKEIELGKETIPKVGYMDIMSNDFWDLQDPGFTKLFPELTSGNQFQEFVLIIIDDIKFNKTTNKVEIIQKRQKFWF
jgi:hypothetical protein